MTTREHEPLEATLRRLEQERDEANRLYNEALTALDRAAMPPRELPHPPPPYDEQHITPLNQSWDLGAAAPQGGGLKGRLAAFVWRMIGPPLQKQTTFNSLIVQHLNRNVTAHREAQRAIESTIALLRDQTADLLVFHSRLLVYLQHITPYVDTTGRQSGGQALIVNAALNAMAEELAKRWESLTAREQRFESRVAGLTAAHEELRTLIGVSQQVSMTVKREMERLVSRDAGLKACATTQGTLPTAGVTHASGPAPTDVAHASGPAPTGVAHASGPAPTDVAHASGTAPTGVAHGSGPAPTDVAHASGTAPTGVAHGSGPAPTDVAQAFRPAFTGVLDAYKYVGFENEFRGSQETIRARLESYLPYFAGASDVLDVGCGRGEFLDLLKARGIAGRGLDLNHEMVEVCRARGLDVAESDVVSYLDALPDASLGGLIAVQVVEHLQPAYLLRFLDLAYHKLRPGSPIVLETLNPACWTAFFDSFIRDLTHVWPLHPETLRYFVLASGFSAARIEFRSPVAPQDRLQPVARLRGDAASTGAAGVDAATADLVETINANVEKLNARMFTFLDYAIVGGR